MRDDAALPSASELVVWAAAAGTAVLAVTSTGSTVVAAVLFGVANRSRWSGLVAVLATAAVAIRFATAGFDDLAGIQSVLGAAGVVGPPAAAASSWAAAAAVLLAVRGLDPGGFGGSSGSARRSGEAVLAFAGGALAATIVAGPGVDDLWLRVLSTAIATALAVGVVAGQHRPPLRRARPWLALAAAAAAVALASWPT